MQQRFTFAMFYVNKFYIYIFWSEQVSASARFSIWGKWNERFLKTAVFIYFINFVMFTFCFYYLTQQVTFFFALLLSGMPVKRIGNRSEKNAYNFKKFVGVRKS